MIGRRPPPLPAAAGRLPDGRAPADLVEDRVPPALVAVRVPADEPPDLAADLEAADFVVDRVPADAPFASPDRPDRVERVD